MLIPPKLSTLMVQNEVPLLQNQKGRRNLFSGGIRLSQISQSEWLIDPVCIAGRACSVGPSSNTNLSHMLNGNGIQIKSTSEFGVFDGSYYEKIFVVDAERACIYEDDHRIYEQKMQFFLMQGLEQNEGYLPTDFTVPLDVNVAYNFSTQMKYCLIALADLHSTYHTMLTIGINAGKETKFSNLTTSQIFTQVHSFYTALGSAKDYLAWLVAIRIGLPNDCNDLAKLVAALNINVTKANCLPIKVMLENQAFGYDGKKIVQIDWMNEIRQARKNIVHKIPYGSRHSEKHGAIVKSGEFYKYSHTIKIGEDDFDVLDVCFKHAMRMLRISKDLQADLNA
jgi:hypothetical protein